jgi:hypothetical protein
MKEVNFLNETKVRGFSEDVSHEIDEFEKLLNISLPPIYKLFYRTFDVNSYFSTYPKYFLNPKFNKISHLPGEMKYEISKVDMPSFEYFMDLKISIQAYNNYDEFNLEKEKLLPIIKLSNEMIINVGFGKKNLDSIVLLDIERDELFLQLGDNIFHFLRSVIIAESPVPESLYNKLYLNWNEDFWRVKDNK